jgi:hypothetical protein
MPSRHLTCDSFFTRVTEQMRERLIWCKNIIAVCGLLILFGVLVNLKGVIYSK